MDEKTIPDAAAILGAADASVVKVPEIFLDAVQFTDAEVTTPDFHLDPGMIDGEITERDAKDRAAIEETSGSDLGLVQRQPSLQSQQVLPKRRAILFGAIGAAALIGILVLALRPAPRPARIVAPVRASAQRLAAAEPNPAAVDSAPAQPSIVPGASSAPAPSAKVLLETDPPGGVVASSEEGFVKIEIAIKPDGSLLTYKGKTMGRTPFMLKHPRNEKRTYEVGKAGYTTRRVVVTGTERKIGLELQQDVPHPDSL